MKRAKFNQRRQEDGESVDAFITALYTLSEHCNYGNLHDEMIRDRIVVGIRDAVLAEKLQLDPELTLEKAVTRVRQAEAVKQQQPTIRGETKEALVGKINKPGKPHEAKPKPPGRYARKPVRKPKTGEGDKCTRCGRTPSHDKQNCPARDAACIKYGKKGHFQIVCRSTGKLRQILTTDSDPEEEVFLGAVGPDKSSQWEVALEVNGKNAQFHIDTGAEVSVITGRTYLAIGSPVLSQARRTLRGPDNRVLRVRGQFTGSLKSGKSELSCKQEIYVIENLGRNLLGGSAIAELALVSRIDSIRDDPSQTTVPRKFARYAKLFQGLGKLQGDYKIELKEGATPFALSTPRRVAIPRLKAVKEELERMEALGVIERVTQPTSWCAGMVVVPKEGG